MGNRESNESAAVKRQAEGFSNPTYRMLDLGVSLSHTSLDTIAANPLALQGGGLFLELSKKAMLTGKTSELDEAIRSKVSQEYWLMMRLMWMAKAQRSGELLLLTPPGEAVSVQ